MAKNRNFHVFNTILMEDDVCKMRAFKKYSADMGNVMTDSRTIKTLMLMGWQYWMLKKNEKL